MAGTGIYGQILRAQLENAAADLTPTAIGLLYYNTTSNIVKWYTGAAWKTAVDTDSTQGVSGKTFTSCTLSGASNTLSNISLSSQVTGTLPIGNGGTGQTTANSALNALLPSQATHAGKVLSTNGTDTSWVSAATVPGTVGSVYSDGSALQSTAFAGNGNEVLGVNSGATGQEFKALSVGTSGTDFAIAHSAGAIAFNLPDASASARGAVTTAAQTIAGDKTFTGTTQLGPTSSGGSSTTPINNKVYGKLSVNTTDAAPIYTVDSYRKHTDSDVDINYWRLDFATTEGRAIVRIFGGYTRHNNSAVRVFAWYDIRNSGGTITITDLGAGTTNLGVSSVSTTTGTSQVTFTVPATGGGSRRSHYITIEVSGGGDVAALGGSTAATYTLTRL